MFSNAYIDFSKMTSSVVAVVTDVVRDGKPGKGVNELKQEMCGYIDRGYTMVKMKNAWSG